jgi:hypothetical protein
LVSSDRSSFTPFPAAAAACSLITSLSSAPSSSLSPAASPCRGEDRRGLRDNELANHDIRTYFSEQLQLEKIEERENQEHIKQGLQPPHFLPPQQNMLLCSLSAHAFSASTFTYGITATAYRFPPISTPLP